MKNGVCQQKFRAKPYSGDLDLLKEKSWNWVPRIQIVVGFFLISNLIYYANIAEGWKGYLSDIIAIGLLFWFVSSIQKRIAIYKTEQYQSIYNLRRQMTAFICDSALGRIDTSDLNRISHAATSLRGKGKDDDLSVDDFSLISRAWYFWKDQNGFECQAGTECINCGFERREHSQDGSCPVLP